MSPERVVVWLNVTTEDGELLERVEVEIEPGEDGRIHLSPAYGAWLVDEIRGAMQTVVARRAS